MRLGRLTVLQLALVAPVLSAQTNTATPAPFAPLVIAKYPQLTTLNSMVLSGTAEWIAGSTHESGPVSIQASVDGSSTLQLTLNTASRTETRTSLGASRACQWTDAKSVAHTLIGPDCDQAVPWFAPLVFVEPSASVAGLLSVSDDGEVTRNGATFHELSYTTQEQGTTPAFAQTLTQATRVSVLYDPQTLRPASIEFDQHADNNLKHALNVRVVYSNYQLVEGLPIPFQIDRYVNNALQLSIAIDHASIN